MMNNMEPKQRMRTSKFLVILLALCLLVLPGCVRYEVGVNFEGQYRGTIIQHVKLGQLTSLNQSEADNWLDSIEDRAQRLQGRTQRTPQEIIVTIPFSSGQELVSKFNGFFNSTQSAPLLTQTDTLDVLKLDSVMSLKQSNLLLFQRNRLRLNIDLRALGVLSEEGNLIVSPGSLIDLEFGIRTPLGVRSTKATTVPEQQVDSSQLVWQLQPGQINAIEAVFWLPNALGIGTVAIALLVILGFYLKYRRFPWVTEPV